MPPYISSEILLYKLESQEYELESQHLQLGNDIDVLNLSSKLKEQKSQIEDLKRLLEMGPNPTPVESISESIEAATEEIKLTEEGIEAWSSVGRKVAQEGADIKSMDHSIANSKQRLVGYRAISIFGLLLAISGFALWYFKLQRHLDKMLEKSPWF